MSSVRERSDVRREADKLGLTVFFAMLAELCFLKGSELPVGDPGRVYKGRHVLLGDQVKDGQFDAAEFQDLGSAPPTMMAARIIDLWSLQYGFILTQSDATSAYTQEFIGGGRGKGVPTWLSLPRHRWPPEWEGRFVHPVVLLILALYGHPDAGAFWERKCEGALLSCGWTKTCWQGLFMHKKTNSLLIVYVDDFRMAAKAEYTPRLWDEIRVKLVVDDPSAPQRFLGVVQYYFEEPVEKLGYFLDHHPRVRGREAEVQKHVPACLLYTSPSPRDGLLSRMPSSA